MNTLAIEAEVDSQGWLNIHAPAPPGTLPGKLDVVAVWSPPVPQSPMRIRTSRRHPVRQGGIRRRFSRAVGGIPALLGMTLLHDTHTLLTLPFDRLLLAQVKAEGMTLVTDDGQFGAYGVPLLW